MSLDICKGKGGCIRLKVRQEKEQKGCVDEMFGHSTKANTAVKSNSRVNSAQAYDEEETKPDNGFSLFF